MMSACPEFVKKGGVKPMLLWSHGQALVPAHIDQLLVHHAEATALVRGG